MTEERSSNVVEALEHFRAIRNLTRKVRFESPMDVAYAELLEAVAEELVRQQSALPAIRRSTDTLKLPVDTVPQNKILRQPPIKSPPRVMRPMSHWVEHIPDYDDNAPDHARALYESKRRVRPEDVQLTEEELERIYAPKPRVWHENTIRELFWLAFWMVMIISVLGFLVWYL